MELREIRQSLIRLYILIAASNRPLDSAGITATLQARGFALSLASTRHILRASEGKGYLTSRKVRNICPHKEYTITAAGRRRAREAKRKIGELMEAFGQRKAFDRS